MAQSNAAHQTILVVGGGISGLTVAVEAAEVGYEVILVEKEPSLGGRVSQLNKYFPKLCLPACGLEINYQRIKRNTRIRFFTLAQVTKITGTPGAYTATIRQDPRFVNDKCTGCGTCEKECQTEVANPFDFGMSKVKAIRNSHNMAYPHRFFMDAQFAKSQEAKQLVSVCPVGAIEPDMQAKTSEIPVGAIVWATGWQPYDASKIQPYGFGRFANVTNNMRFERLASVFGPTQGRLVRPSDGQEVKKIAFIQCAGSRDQNHLAFCSRVCCLASMKQASYVREQYPDAQVTIYYIDLRAMDRYEGFQKKTEADPNIRWIKSKPARIDEDGQKNPVVIGEDTLTGIRYAEPYDLVVLATGMQPNSQEERIPGENVVYDEHGFVVSQQSNGIISVGCTSSPLDVASAVQSATSAALKAIQTLVNARG